MRKFWIAAGIAFTAMAAVLIYNVIQHDKVQQHIIATEQSAFEESNARMGVRQIKGQEWREFSAAEIKKARADLQIKPATLAKGEQEAIILRTVETHKPGVYDCVSPFEKHCWAALVVRSSDKDLEYRIVYTVLDRIEPLKACYRQGDRVIIKWGDFLVGPGGLDTTQLDDITRLDQIRHSDPKKVCPAPAPART